MLVNILGSAAGGAFPQWNCVCPNCQSLRAGTFHGKARTQAQVAISADSNSWFLLGASPDLHPQIESTPELHPRKGFRQSPISGVVLLNANAGLRAYPMAALSLILCSVVWAWGSIASRHMTLPKGAMASATQRMRVRAERKMDWVRDVLAYLSRHVDLPRVSIPRPLISACSGLM